MAIRLLDGPPPDSVDRSYHHLDRCRRIRVGPALTLVFEDRQTLWFRTQELAGCPRRAGDADVRRLHDWYRRLLPSEHRLLAALRVDVPGRRAIVNLDNLRDLVAGGRLRLRSDTGHEIEATLLPERVRDRLLGLVGWVEFPFAAPDRRALEAPGREWRLALASEGYRHRSEPLAPPMLRSLLADLGRPGAA